MTCLQQVNNGAWCQESYESASRDAGRRVKQLRKAGYTAFSSPMGSQVTPLGVLKLTMVDVRPGSHEDTFDLPEEGWTREYWRDNHSTNTGGDRNPPCERKLTMPAAEQWAGIPTDRR